MIDPPLCYYFGAWEAKTTSRSASCGAAWWRASALWRRLPQTAWPRRSGGVCSTRIPRT